MVCQLGGHPDLPQPSRASLDGCTHRVKRVKTVLVDYGLGKTPSRYDDIKDELV
jgi:hypothetical protein